MAAITGTVSALVAAFSHLLFNIIGIVIIYCIPVLRNIPLKCAEIISEQAVTKKYLPLLYLFFILWKTSKHCRTRNRKIIDWLGFSWDDSYLRTDKSQQGFYTASNVKVRSPINNKSVGGWKKYGTNARSHQFIKKNKL